MMLCTAQAVQARFPNADPARRETGWAAAEAYVADRCRWPEDTRPDGLVEAVLLLTGRFLARHNSPDGLVGGGELGPARIATLDRDAERLMQPYRKVVFG